MRALLAASLIAFAPLAASADWILSGEESKLTFGSIKKDSVGESHHFSGLTGVVDASGDARVEIDLASLETWIDIRNERMAEQVFKGMENPFLTATVDLAGLEALAPGETSTADLEGVLTFGDAEIEIEAPIFVARLSEDRALIASDEIIFVGTADLGITEGIDKLMEIAELPSITRAVPVSFRFVFTSDGEVSAADSMVAKAAAATINAEAEPAASQSGDPDAGAKVYRKCRACHVADEEKNKVGPHLVGIVGRKAGSVDGFKYSKAFQALDYDWTVERLSAYLADPKGYVKGTKMSFAGLKKDEDVANVIAYLESLN